MTEPLASDAEKLRNAFGSEGISVDQITKKHLAEYYATIPAGPTLPDYQTVNIRYQDFLPKVSDAPLVGVIIETRKHHNLVFVVRQMQKHLKIPIQLFHSADNREFIRRSKLGQSIRDGSLILTELDRNQINADAYNHLFSTKEFWNALIGREKILVFQTDSVLCACARLNISDFTDFDYIGSGWQRTRPSGRVVDGGNGGFSLRDWSKSVECLDRFPPENPNRGEDGYFAFYIELIGGYVGKTEDCNRFSTQNYLKKRSLGAHKLDDLSPLRRLLLLGFCPAAWRILPRIRQIRDRLDRSFGK